MMRLTVTTIALTLLVTAIAGDDNNSVPLVVLDSADYGDTNFLMRIEEIKRNPKTSVLKMTYKKMGSSVGSSMFIMRGFYEVAKSRSNEYFINLKEWDAEDGGRLYIGGFTDKQNADIHSEFGSEFALTNEYGQARIFMSVSQCNLLWGRQEMNHRTN